MDYWHSTIANEDRATLLPDERTLREAVRALAAAVPEECILFNLVDSHIHVVVLGSRARAGRLAQAISLSLRPLVVAPLASARIRQVNGRRHLETLVSYVIRQDRNHGTLEHRALASGSCFQDIMGARTIEGFRLRLADVLPRFSPKAAYCDLGLGANVLEPADERRIRHMGPGRLIAAAATAVCVGPILPPGKSARVLGRARRAAASLGRKSGLRSVDLAELLGISQRGLRALATAHPDPAAEQATRVRLALEDQVAGRPPMDFEQPPPPSEPWG